MDEGLDTFVIKQLSLTGTFRGSKLEKILLDEFESVMADKKEKEIEFSYRFKEGENADYIMNILKENGWQEPNFICRIFVIKKEILNWKWLNVPLADGMKTYKWNQLPKEIIDKLVIEQKSNRSFPDYILTYLRSNKFSHERSAALVIGGNIIGWLFVEVTEINNFIYSYFYSKKQFQRSAICLVKLFKETISNVVFPSDFNLILVVNAENHNMFYLVNKKWKPYISSIHREYYSKKKL